MQERLHSRASSRGKPPTSKPPNGTWVERQGVKTVTMQEVRVKEHELPGFRNVWKQVPVWKQVKEPCMRIVKQPIIVPVTKEVPYTW